MRQMAFHSVAGQLCPCLLGPFHGHNPSPVKIVSPAKMVKILWRVDSIEVDVGQRKMPVVFMDKDEGRTSNLCLRGLEPLRQPSNELCFPDS